MTPDSLKACVACSSTLADEWADPLTAAMERWEINTPKREAAFLATVGVESQRLLRGREDLHYRTTERLMQIFGTRIQNDEASRYLRDPVALGNRVYANRMGNGDEASGDGYLFRGGGPIGLTGRDNYTAFSEASGHPTVENPSCIEQPDIGAESAAWFWSSNGCNDIIDEDDFIGTQGIVNAGSRHTPSGRINGFDERLALWKACKHVLGLA